MIRAFDATAAALGLLVLSPLLLVVLVLVWRQDGHSPFYVADRAGRGGKPFRMVKIRSMVVNAHASGVESTAVDDRRITPLGHFIRRWKIDEIGQLWNVLVGDMSLVGPRPNTLREVMTYSPAELRLLDIRPGITDFSSIVFSDEGQILAHSADPDAAYERLIRPWKSRLALLYVNNLSLPLSLALIGLTALAIFNRPGALRRLEQLLASVGADPQLQLVATRSQPLERFAPGPQEAAGPP